MIVLFIFTAILTCMCARLVSYFFKQGTTVPQLVTIVLLLALTMILIGYMSGSFNIPILDKLIIR